MLSSSSIRSLCCGLVLLSTVHALAAGDIFLRQSETPLSTPDCVIVGDKFTCDINMELASSASSEGPSIVVEAFLECPLKPGIGMNLSATDPKSCGCSATLTEEGNATGRPPRQCSCHYCKAVPNKPLDLAINCSQFTADPYVKGTCKAMDCDGTCLDKNATNTNTNNSKNATTTSAPSPAPSSAPSPTTTNLTQTNETTTAPTTGPDNASSTMSPTLAATNASIPTPSPTGKPSTDNDDNPTGGGADDTPCPELCPNGRHVPDANREIVVDVDRRLTCASILESLSAGEDLFDSCLEVAKFSATCCTKDATPTAPTLAPTPMPTAVGTRVLPINNSFLVHNEYGLTADVLAVGPDRATLSRAYAALVEQVVQELGEGDNSTAGEEQLDTNQSRYIRTRTLTQHHHRRRLSVALDSTSAQVSTFRDAPCPPIVSFNSSYCAVAYASYNLFLLNEDDSYAIAGQYTNYTQDAIDRGLLEELLVVVDPLTWLKVREFTQDPVPLLDVVPFTRSPQAEAQDGGYAEYFMLGLGCSIAVIVVCLVAIICASDNGRRPGDDDSVDPWEKREREKSRKNLLEKAAASEKDLSNKPKTDRQEYLMYRGQVEELVLQKVPEEFDNIDDLLDVFYDKELVLVATLKHMPDCSEHAAEEEDEEEVVEEEEKHEYKNNTTAFNNSLEDWDSDSSDEFGEEGTRDGSEDDDDDGGVAKGTKGGTINEGDEEKDDSKRRDDHAIGVNEAEPGSKQEPAGKDDSAAAFKADEEDNAPAPREDHSDRDDEDDEDEVTLEHDKNRNKESSGVPPPGGDIGGSSAKQQEEVEERTTPTLSTRNDDDSDDEPTGSIPGGSSPKQQGEEARATPPLATSNDDDSDDEPTSFIPARPPPPATGRANSDESSISGEESEWDDEKQS